LVAIDERASTAYFAEAKWTGTPIGRDVLHKLRRKAESFPWRKESRNNLFLVYSRSGFSITREEDVHLFSLQDIGKDMEQKAS